MSLPKVLLLILLLMTLSYSNYNSTAIKSNSSIKKTIKQSFTIPKKCDHKSTHKPKNRKPIKIKKDMGIIVKAS